MWTDLTKSAAFLYSEREETGEPGSTQTQTKIRIEPWINAFKVYSNDF